MRSRQQWPPHRPPRRSRNDWAGFDAPWSPWARPRRRLHKTRKVGSFGVKVVRRGWVRRRPLAPLYLCSLVFVLGAVAHMIPNGWRSMAGLSGVIAVMIGGWQAVASRSSSSQRRMRRNEWIWTGAVWASCTGWLCCAAIDGVMPPVLGYLWLGILPPAWIAAAFRYRVRPKVTTAAELDERASVWNEVAAAADGIAPGSTMGQPTSFDPQDPTLGWRAPIKLSWRGQTLASKVVGSSERIGLLYDQNAANIAVEQIGESPRDLDLTVFTRNPLRDREWWPGPDVVFDATTGIASIARYITGGHAQYRYFGESGPVHDMIAGATGTGKSALVNALLAIERGCPLMSSVVIDPQRGQSLPAWVRSVALYGRSILEGRVILIALLAEMFRRNALLSDVEWTDDKGRTRYGVDSFDPNSPIVQKLGLTLICVTIEEAAMQLTDDESLGAVVAMSTMARKCGIKLRLLFQTPLLDQVRSTVLRDQLIGGNVVVFRTGSPVSSNVILNGVLPASPHLLPREWADGSTASGVCYILGPGARSVVARTWPIEDVYHWATTGETTMLPDLTNAAQGAKLQANAVDAEVIEETIGAPGKSYIDRVLAFVSSRGTVVTTGTINQQLGGKLSTTSTSCARLAKRGLIVDGGNGLWGPVAVEAEAAA